MSPLGRTLGPFEASPWPLWTFWSPWGSYPWGSYGHDRRFDGAIVTSTARSSSLGGDRYCYGKILIDLEGTESLARLPESGPAAPKSSPAASKSGAAASKSQPLALAQYWLRGLQKVLRGVHCYVARMDIGMDWRESRTSGFACLDA